MRRIEARSSVIEGLGIFATTAFIPGDVIAAVHVVREVTAETPIRPELGERIEHCAYPDGKTVLIAFPERHVNHSCDPNAFEKFEGQRSFFVALRPINMGEEITIDYNINITMGTSWPCHCGAARCTGRVEGEFFNLPVDRQREYRPLLAEWFVQRNHERISVLDPQAVR